MQRFVTLNIATLWHLLSFLSFFETSSPLDHVVYRLEGNPLLIIILQVINGFLKISTLHILFFDIFGVVEFFGMATYLVQYIVQI